MMGHRPAQLGIQGFIDEVAIRTTVGSPTCTPQGEGCWRENGACVSVTRSVSPF
jgi:hypothetical protein